MGSLCVTFGLRNNDDAEDVHRASANRSQKKKCYGPWMMNGTLPPEQEKERKQERDYVLEPSGFSQDLV